jgi:multimeric flavodoxin WrbA
VLKLMMDRLVCADGGNPDVTSTHGKTVAEAKQLEADGWNYPKHLAGRAFGLIVHGDAGGVESQRRNLADWLQWMGLVDAGTLSQLDRYIGYYEPYWNSHEALDRDRGVQDEARNVAEAIVRAVALVRRNALARPDAGMTVPRPK